MNVFHDRQLAKKFRSGFTLIELLLVVSMIAVLSTLAVGVMGSAVEDSRAAATRSRARIITSILEQELEDFEVRPLPVGLSQIQLVVQSNYGGVGFFDVDNDGLADKPLLLARNLGRRVKMDMIRCELPNNPADLVTSAPAGFYFPSQRFLNEFNSRYTNDNALFVDPNAPTIRTNFLNSLYRYAPSGALSWQGFGGDLPAEFLYEILSRINVDGAAALDAVGNQAIGDSDGDGLLEIVDGWGDPIEFVIQQKYLLERVSSGVNTEQWGENVAGTSFANINPGFAAVQFTDLGRSLPNESSEVRVLITSARLRAVDYASNTFSAFAGPKPDDFEPTFDPTTGNSFDPVENPNSTNLSPTVTF